MNKIFFFVMSIVLGAIATAAGIYMTFFERNGFVETTAVIDHIDEIYVGTDADNMSEYQYDVYVNYTVDGKDYQSRSDYFSGRYKPGMEIKIFYDPSDPSRIHGDSLGFGIYLLIIGPILFAVPVILFIREKTLQRKNRGSVAQ